MKNDGILYLSFISILLILVFSRFCKFIIQLLSSYIKFVFVVVQFSYWQIQELQDLFLIFLNINKFLSMSLQLLFNKLCKNLFPRLLKKCDFYKIADARTTETAIK